MPRMRFAKTGNAVWISHLDLMRALQRSFRRAGIPLKHSQGFTPHPQLSIAMPLSVGVSSEYEIADFELENGAEVNLAQLPQRLNSALPKGIEVIDCYENGQKLKQLKWLKARLDLLYDAGVPDGCADALRCLFASKSLVVEKHGKNGPVTVDIAPMIYALEIAQTAETVISVTATVSAQNPTLNPLLLLTAIEMQLPSLRPSFSRCTRLTLYDSEMQAFY